MQIPNYIILWLANFLSDRTQLMRVRNSLSELAEVKSGVPQGSVLSPLLFIIYINDIYKLPISSNILSFADDTKLMNLSKNFKLLQRDLIFIQEWCDKNNLFINIEKTVVMHFGHDNFDAFYTINNSKLNVVSEVKDLGLLVDN